MTLLEISPILICLGACVCFIIQDQVVKWRQRPNMPQERDDDRPMFGIISPSGQQHIFELPRHTNQPKHHRLWDGI